MFPNYDIYIIVVVISNHILIFLLSAITHSYFPTPPPHFQTSFTNCELFSSPPLICFPFGASVQPTTIVNQCRFFVEWILLLLLLLLLENEKQQQNYYWLFIFWVFFLFHRRQNYRIFFVLLIFLWFFFMMWKMLAIVIMLLSDTLFFFCCCCWSPLGTWSDVWRNFHKITLSGGRKGVVKCDLSPFK